MADEKSTGTPGLPQTGSKRKAWRNPQGTTDPIVVFLAAAFVGATIGPELFQIMKEIVRERTAGAVDELASRFFRALEDAAHQQKEQLEQRAQKKAA